MFVVGVHYYILNHKDINTNYIENARLKEKARRKKYVKRNYANQISSCKLSIHLIVVTMSEKIYYSLLAIYNK